MNAIPFISVLLVSFLLSACGDNSCKTPVDDNASTALKTTAFYADNEHNIIDVIDVDKMQLITTLSTGHKDTHTAGIALNTKDSTKLYVSNRHDNYIDVIDTHLDNIIQSIHLNFYPRSINVENDTSLVEVASTNKPVAAIIDAKSDSVLATVGDLSKTVTNKCGHPYWLNSEDFVFIDRENKKIYTYNIKKINGTWVTKKINELDTPSPVHHIATPNINGKRNYNASVFYAMAEGDSTHYPSVLKLDFNKTTGLDINETLKLTKNGVDVADIGGHHLNFLKDGKTLYAGSKEGDLFVVDYSSSPMKIIKTIPVGKGAGHTVEMKDQNLAVIINHNDTFISFIDTALNKKIADIEVSHLTKEQAAKVQVQSHTSYYFSPDGRYFYLFLTEEGDMVKVDLLAQKVVNRLHLGGKLQMGSFIHSH